MKKFTSILLTALMLAAMLTVFAVPASAEEEFTSGDYKYTVSNDGTATITMYTGNGGNVEIPAAFDGHTVTAIGGYAFVNCGGIKTLTISDGVKSIGTKAFQGCNKIASVTIPEGVTSIGADAFNGCAFQKVTIPGTVTSIGTDAFANCDPNLVINGPYSSAAEKYARENSVAFTGEGTCSHIFCLVCDSCHKSLTKSDLLNAWGNTATASTLSEGSLTVICSVACLAVGLVGGLLIGKKKTKPALADGTDNTEEE